MFSFSFFKDNLRFYKFPPQQAWRDLEFMWLRKGVREKEACKKLWEKMDTNLRTDQDFCMAICVLLGNFKFRMKIWPWKTLRPEKRRLQLFCPGIQDSKTVFKYDIHKIWDLAAWWNLHEFTKKKLIKAVFWILKTKAK